MIIEIGNVSYGENPVTRDKNAYTLSGQKNEYSGWEFLCSNEIRDSADVFIGWNRGITGAPGFYRAGSLSLKCSVNIAGTIVRFSGVKYVGTDGYRLIEIADGAPRDFRIAKIEKGQEVFLENSDGQRKLVGSLSLRMYASVKPLEVLMRDNNFVNSARTDTLAELLCRKLSSEYNEYIGFVSGLPAAEIIDLASTISAMQNVLIYIKKNGVPRNDAVSLIQDDNALFGLAEKYCAGVGAESAAGLFDKRKDISSKKDKPQYEGRAPWGKDSFEKKKQEQPNHAKQNDKNDAQTKTSSENRSVKEPVKTENQSFGEEDNDDAMFSSGKAWVPWEKEGKNDKD